MIVIIRKRLPRKLTQCLRYLVRVISFLLLKLVLWFKGANVTI